MEAAAFAGSACALKTTRYVCAVPVPVARTPGTARSKATIATDAKIARRRGAWNLVMVHPSSCASGDRLFGGGDPLDYREGTAQRADREAPWLKSEIQNAPSPPQSPLAATSLDRCYARASRSVLATSRDAPATRTRPPPAARARSPCDQAHRARRTRRRPDRRRSPPSRGGRRDGGPRTSS